MMRAREQRTYFENTGTWFEEVETETKLPGLVISRGGFSVTAPKTGPALWPPELVAPGVGESK